MSREDIIAVAARLFALFLFVMVLRTGTQAIAFASMDSDTGIRALAGYAVVALLLSGLALLLWFFPLSIARKLLPVMKEPRSESSAGTDTLFSLAIAVMGLWLLANAIIDAVYWGTLLATMRQQELPPEYLTPDMRGGIVATGVEALVAVLMILGGNRIRDLTYRLRHARTGDVRDDAAPSDDAH